MSKEEAREDACLEETGLPRQDLSHRPPGNSNQQQPGDLLRKDLLVEELASIGRMAVPVALTGAVQVSQSYGNGTRTTISEAAKHISTLRQLITNSAT